MIMLSVIFLVATSWKTDARAWREQLDNAREGMASGRGLDAWITSQPPSASNEGAWESKALANFKNLYGCTNTPGWSDGTNGCDAYYSFPDWCDIYGGWNNGQGAAQENCCICGGGTRWSDSLTWPTLEMMVGGTCAGKSNTGGHCVAWANTGYCTGSHADYMSTSCDLACCQKAAGPPAPPAPASAAPPAPVSGKRCEAKQSNVKPLDVVRINSVKDITYDQCEALCEGNQECAGFVYQKHTRRIECWMYKSTNGVVDVPEKENKSFTSCPIENPCLGRINFKAPYGPGYAKCGELITNFGVDKRMLNECNLACCEMRNNLDFTTTAPEAEVAEFDRLETVNSALRIALESLVN